MKYFLLISLFSTTFNVTAENKNYLTLYNKYKHIFNKVQSSKGSTTFASVGNDPTTCDFDTIQAAIDSGVDEVKIQMLLTFNENLTIQNQSIKLVGGFLNCASANNGFDATSVSYIDGSDLAPVINIDNDNSFYEVSIDNLWLQNGNSGINFLGGGLEAKGILTTIRMENIRVIDNAGSGINVEDIDQLIIKDAYIANNNAIVGGGIACSATFVTVYGKVDISSNSVSSSGGGVYAYNQCNFSMFSGQPHQATARSGIKFNTSPNQGAGIYAYDGSEINLNGVEVDFGNGQVLGVSSRPVFISFNDAGSHGAGLYLSGPNTQANLTGVNFENNESETGNGGGIAVYDQASLIITRYDLPCWSDIKCNNFFFNLSGTGANGGGAIYAENNSTIALGNTYFEKNSATFGTALWITGSTTATIEGSVFTNNKFHQSRTGNYVIGVESSSALTIGFNTFVDNLALTSTIALFDSTMTNAGNLFYEYEMASVLSQSLSTVTNNCILSRNTTGLVGTTIIQNQFDPFVDRNNQDFHLDEMFGMSAVDLCDSSVYSPSLKDMDHEPRGIDIPLPNNNGPFDVGADEFFIEELFANGFE